MTELMRPSAVIFDCDGTLADSEPLCERAWTGVLQARGYRPTEEDFRRCRGISYADTRNYFAELSPGLPSGSDLYGIYWAELARLYRAELRGFPDAMEVLAGLRHRLPVAIASSSYRHRLDLTLELVGVQDVPTVAGDEVARAKPAPDLFLAAAQQLGIDPRLCLVIEDSQAGVDAANAAGMPAIVLNRQQSEFTGAVLVTDALRLTDIFGAHLD